LKISGAQWNERNVPQVLKLRCAYLNGTLWTRLGTVVLAKLTCSPSNPAMGSSFS
jgi:hypothetical protein